MIGGEDTVVEGAPVAGEGVEIVKAIRERFGWAELVVQGAEAEHYVGALDPTVASMREFFVYQSPAAFASWQAHGCTEANDDTMVHVIVGDASTTLVHAPSVSLDAVRAAVVTWRGRA